MASSKSTQDFVPIEEIRDGIVILKDGSLRSVIMASSVNFALKSNEERTSILYQFQNFLNSIDFSVQIFIQSRRLDIRPYIALLENKEKDQSNELLKIQTKEYIDFIKKFTDSTNIMTKNFFVVVPYSPSVLSKRKKRGLLKRKKAEGNSEESFEENRTQLEQRLSVVEGGLTSSGIRIARLGTEEVTELFYKLFNPGETEKPIKLQ
ncbi:MAG: TraC family protein [Candidatus Pacebacteria bacterium]|nr:TraC family protein [Candidatus Paceibacterota bacterium]